MHLERIESNSIDSHPELLDLIEREGRIFQHPLFLQSVGERLRLHVVKEDEKIMALMPLVLTSKGKFKASFIPQHAHTYGPIFTEEGKKVKLEVMSVLSTAIKEYPLVELKMPLDDSDILPFIQCGGKVFATQTHIVDASQGYDVDSIHHSKRRYLKKLLTALKAGEITMKEGAECTKDLVWLQEQTAAKSGFQTNLGHLEKIMKALGNEKAYSLVLYSSKGEPLSGAYCPFDTTHAYHVINASVNHSDSLLNRSNILSTFLAVSKAVERGLSFDFEGSNIPGVATYYRLMGGTPRLFYRIEFSENILGRLFFSYRHFAK